MLEDVMAFYENLCRESIIFCFNGPISQSLIEGIGDVLRQKMKLEDTSTGVSQKVFGIFVEQMQNVINYSAEKKQEQLNGSVDVRSGVLIVTHKNGRYCIYSGNYIKNSEKAYLSEQLDLLKSMNQAELKAYYREQRKNPPPEGSKGAGLGFIETARKASEPLEYKLQIKDEDMAFFSLKALV